MDDLTGASEVLVVVEVVRQTRKLIRDEIVSTLTQAGCARSSSGEAVSLH
ncbi:MAG: hypothetical protein LC808_32980 [Actinobacteria bacterium]|nr:hypothetical protein [Actinomycetota bacterium]